VSATDTPAVPNMPFGEPDSGSLASDALQQWLRSAAEVAENREASHLCKLGALPGTGEPVALRDLSDRPTRIATPLARRTLCVSSSYGMAPAVPSDNLADVGRIRPPNERVRLD
jgi:hypothetical protein